MEFKVSAELKNIIGKDLIVNDEVAIFELVKNSYDAHATKVDIIFENDKITIKDNGKGMDLNDIQNKWLFVAYSAKKDGTEDSEINDDKYADYRDKIQVKRGYAGAKGIGRFSADRLGTQLKLITKKINSNVTHQIDVNWEKFEQNSKNEFINIHVDHSSSKNIDNLNFENGVILEITNLRSEWDKNKIKKLKRSLGKLINPFEINVQSNNFQIFIKDSNTLFNTPVKNELLDVLPMKTTKIEVIISKDKIITHLVDRGVTIYKIEEKNNYIHLKDSSIVLLYLNHKARINFANIMGVTTKEFPNVMFYNNGFRVYPFGEPGDDSLGIDKRYQQGIRRYLSTRNLIGSININEYTEEFKEKSSRDSGLIETNGYQESKDFFWKSLKRLEKYVVGIQWTLDEVIREEDNNSDNLSILDNLNSKSKIIELITKLVDKEKAKIVEFDGNFLNIIKDKIDISNPIINNLVRIAEKTKNTQLLNEIDNAKKKIQKLASNKIQIEKELFEEQDKNIKLQSEKSILSKQLNEEKVKLNNVSKELEAETKRNIFQSSIIGMEKEQILGLQHQIYHSSSRINRNIELLLKSFNNISEKQKKYISVITHEAEKIISISNFVTKANFNLTASEITTDLISFINEYINELYLSQNKIIDSRLSIISINTFNEKYIMRIKPLEITTLIDNLIQNAQKADAQKVVFEYKKEDKDLLLLIKDNGKGIEKDRIKHIFELGYTTTDGSGIGLFNVLSTMKKMKGSIEVNSELNNGTTFILRFKNAN